MAAKCGNCGLEGQTVEHVRECYSSRVLTRSTEVTGFAKKYVESRDFKPMALDVPDSCYALETNGVLKFYELRTGKNKWAGFQFLDLLVGAPGTWNHYPVKNGAKKAAMAELARNPREAAVRYSREFTICAVCGSPLSDPESVAYGLGPICRKRFPF